MDRLVFEVETRRRIFETICKYPGIHLRELCRTVDLKLNLVDYHLRYLEKRGIISSTEDSQFKRYFAKDEMGAEQRRDLISHMDKPLVSMLRQPVPFKIVILLAESGVMTHGELTKLLGKSPSTVSHHLSKLLEAKMVIKTDDGRAYRLAEPSRIEKILVAFNPQPLTLSNGFLEIWENLHI